MLKIKDNVDLKELEKYGYIKISDQERYLKTMHDEFYYEYVTISIDREEICFTVTRGSFTWCDTQKRFGYFRTKRYLKDLIKDGIVEKINKVENKK